MFELDFARCGLLGLYTLQMVVHYLLMLSDCQLYKPSHTWTTHLHHTYTCVCIDTPKFLRFQTFFALPIVNRAI